MGVFIYEIKDRQTDEVLFVGREGATAEFLGCARKYLCQLAVGEIRSSKKTTFSNIKVSRLWQDSPVYCVDCGAEIPEAGPNRERCDTCKKARLKQQARRHRQKVKVVKETNCIEYLVPQAQLQKACIGCFYFGGNNHVSSCCNYIFIEGHSRGCPPGVDCTKRKERK